MGGGWVSVNGWGVGRRWVVVGMWEWVGGI